MAAELPLWSATALRTQSFDDRLGRQIIALHVWAVEEGLRGAPASALFDGFCQRLAGASVPLWRGFAGMRTLHPQWAGYSYTWQRGGDALEQGQFERGDGYEQDVSGSPFAVLLARAEAAAASGSTSAMPCLRRRLIGRRAQLDFPVLARLAAAGATDYFAQLIGFGGGDASRGTGIGYSFATDHRDGFRDEDLLLIQAVLPVVSLAIMSEAGHMIAASLLAAYIGADAGGRVHAGAIGRGSVETISAVLCYADIRGWTGIADSEPGPVLVELLNEVFESLIAPIRGRGGQVLKFLGDGILASFPIGAAAPGEICRAALAAAAEAVAAVATLGWERYAAGRPAVSVDVALHLGEVLYGNVGAIDRLDFTVIGPAVNEVARIEALCEILDRNLLLSAEFAAALGDGGARLQPLGLHTLRGVREPRAIFAPLLTT
jgi:adenylate cyclase